MSPALRERRRALALASAGALVLAGSELALLARVPPFPTWFYVFAWWGWIALADGLVHLRTGSSLLLARPRAFALLVPWSVAFWLLFEAANLVLCNWYYVGVPAERWERLTGITVSFATVLPGVIETADLLAAYGVLARRSGPRLAPGRRACLALSAAGALFLVLPLAFPEHLYPLVWGGVVLLVEPALFLAGRRGQLSQLARGEWGTTLRYLAAGALCGLLWEFWNFWCTAKWIYTVPFFEELKLFEMPVAGFLGFPPFALECYTFARLLVALRLVPEFEAGVRPARRLPRVDTELRVLGASAAVLVSALILPWVERLTVRSTELAVEDLVRDPEQRRRLAAAGVASFDGLVGALEDGDLAELLDMTEFERRATLEEARLFRVAGLGLRGSQWLGSVGVYGVDQLAAADPERLVEDLAGAGRGPDPRPYPREVRVWQRRAARAAGAGADGPP